MDESEKNPMYLQCPKLEEPNHTFSKGSIPIRDTANPTHSEVWSLCAAPGHYRAAITMIA